MAEAEANGRLIAAGPKMLARKPGRPNGIYPRVESDQPGVKLRHKPGMNVRVGNHIAPPGGPKIRNALETLLQNVENGGASHYKVHRAYETLHPFSDGNGRSGRAMWLWMMQRQGGAPLGFLHHWYYSSLEEKPAL